MNKQMLIFLFLLLGSTAIIAQPSFGLRAGLAISTIENNALMPQLEYHSKANTALIAGPDIALAVSFPLQGRFSLLTEAHYLIKGGKIEEDFVIPNTGSSLMVGELTTTYKVSYMEFPVLLSYQVLDKTIQPSVLLGASYGRALSQRLEGDHLFFRTEEAIYLLSGESKSLDWDTELPDGGEFNRNDISAVAGLSLATTINQQLLVLDIRYQRDFTDWRTEKSNLNDKPQVRNHNIMFTVGIML